MLVVGSGMGGLTAAAMLAKIGKRVLVLEQHYLPGGFTHAFARGPYVWDVGVHAVGEVTEHTRTGRLLSALSGGRLRWASLGSVYEQFLFPDGLRVDFPDSPEGFRDALLAAFPHEAAAIDAYLSRVQKAVAAIQGHFLAKAMPPGLAAALGPLLGWRARSHLRLSVGEVLEELIEDARLRAVLSAQWGYYGTVPSRAPFAIQALITKHFLHGAFYPVGGAQEISRTMASTVEKAGGWTRVVADVEEILIEKGRAIGVRLADGEELRAAKTVVATGIGTAVRRLLPPEERESDWARAATQVEAGPAHICLYLGFRGDIRAAGAGSANQWFYDTWEPEESLWQIDPREPLPPAPVLYVSFPSLKDPSHDPGPEQLHTGEVVTFVPWSCFEPWKETVRGRRGPDYDDLKQRIQSHLLEQLQRHRPGLIPLIDRAELSTPLSTEHFCRPLAGSIYGLAATRERFACSALRARPPIPGLYFAGSDVTSGGVMGAMSGGMLGALAAEPWGTMRLLRSV